MDRQPKAPSSNVVETLDNGIMVRALERPAEAERLYKEHVQVKEAAKAEATTLKTVTGEGE
ncbi:MAG: hypothetical protein KGL39_40615 [Patescibacteria group bacterium]|nr:hypothetical protein [Patescibacteria group bacterium]